MHPLYYKSINLFTVKLVLRVSTWCLRFGCAALLIACHIAQAQVSEVTVDPGLGTDQEVYSLAVQADGKTIIVGAFTTFDGVPRNGIARLLPDGALDTSFDPGTGADDAVLSLAVQADGKIVIGGNFTTFDGVSRNRIARLMPNGALDPSFDPGTGADNGVKALTIQTDGNILIVGGFTSVNGVTRNYIARLTPNGALDTSFDTGLGVNGWVESLTIQADGKVIIGGWFTTFDGVSRNRIARLTPNGALDTSFDPGLGTNDWMFTLIVQTDGKVIVGGNFTTFDGVSRNGIARLLPNGALDTSFDPELGANNWIRSLAIQTDEKILIGGRFTTFNGVSRNHIARLTPNGALDTSFDPRLGTNDWVNALAVQTDGKIIIGGWFASFNGVPRNHIARLIAPFAAGSQVPIPTLGIVALVTLAGMLCLFGRRHRHKHLISFSCCTRK